MSYTKEFRNSNTVQFSRIWYPGGGTANAIKISDVNYQSPQIGYSICNSVPDFKTKLKSGSDATGNYFMDRYRVIRAKPCYGAAHMHNFDHNTGAPTGDYDEIVSGFPFTGPLDVFSHYNLDLTGPSNKAFIGIRKKLKDMQSHMAGGVFLGELREAVAMIRRPAASLRDLVTRHMDRWDRNFQKIHRGRRVAPKGPLERERIRKEYSDAVSGSILEWNFGAQPLLADVQAGAEALARFHERKSDNRTKVESTGSVAFSQDGTTDDGLFRVIFVVSHYKRMTTVSYRVRAGLLGTVTAPEGSLSRFRQLYGLYPEDFIPTIYQLLPWSFLIDYFSNVGQVIEAGATCTANVAWVNETVLRKTTFNMSNRMEECPTGYDIIDFKIFSPGNAAVVRTTLQRSKLDTLPYPSLEINNPFTSARKLTNIAALWIQQQDTISQRYRLFFRR